VRSADPAVIVLRGYGGPIGSAMVAWLRESGFRSRYVGSWHVFLPPETLDAAHSRGVRLTDRKTQWARGVPGNPIRAFACP
jgi:hypothetical protein